MTKIVGNQDYLLRRLTTNTGLPLVAAKDLAQEVTAAVVECQQDGGRGLAALAAHADGFALNADLADVANPDDVSKKVGVALEKYVSSLSAAAQAILMQQPFADTRAADVDLAALTPSEQSSVVEARIQFVDVVADIIGKNSSRMLGPIDGAMVDLENIAGTNAHQKARNLIGHGARRGQSAALQTFVTTQGPTAPRAKNQALSVTPNNDLAAATPSAAMSNTPLWQNVGLGVNFRALCSALQHSSGVSSNSADRNHARTMALRDFLCTLSLSEQEDLLFLAFGPKVEAASFLSKPRLRDESEQEKFRSSIAREIASYLVRDRDAETSIIAVLDTLTRRLQGADAAS